MLDTCACVLHTTDESEDMRMFLHLLNVRPPSGEFIPTAGDYEVLKHLMDKYQVYPWCWGQIYAFFEERLVRSIGVCEQLWSIRMAHVLRSGALWKAIAHALHLQSWRGVDPSGLDVWDREFLGDAYSVLGRMAMMGSVDRLFDCAHRLCVVYDREYKGSWLTVDDGEASVQEGEVFPETFDIKL